MDLKLLKDALASAPTSVAVVTTRDHDGTPHGFTAGTFSSLSLSPPLILVSLSLDANCHAVFDTAERFAVSVLGARHVATARLMATRDADKFQDGRFECGAHGLPIARDAVAHFICRACERHPGGDHTILIGQVDKVDLGRAEEALVHFQRGFWSVGHISEDLAIGSQPCARRVG